MAQQPATRSCCTKGTTSREHYRQHQRQRPVSENNLRREEAARRAAPARRGVVRHRAGPDRRLRREARRDTFRSRTVVRFTGTEPGADDLPRPDGADAAVSATLNGDRRSATSTATACSCPALASGQRAGRRGRDGLHAHRRGPAPLRRPGRRQRLPLQPVRDLRRAPGLRLLRPARPEGRRSASPSARPRDWEVISNGAVVDRPAERRARHLAVRRDAADVDLHHRASSPARTTACATRTTASTWASTAAARWRSTSTRTSCSLITKQGFDFYHRVFDYRYPFGKYDQLFVPEFNAGAMENAGAVTFLEDYVFRSKVTDASYERRAETVLHEMAHMWFGDLVTMRWWDDLWLNESFATYMSVLCQVEATRFTGGWTTFANTEKTWAYRQDQLPSTHPIAADIPDMEAVKVNFDGITYAKGASVLKQLVAWVGQDAFLGGAAHLLREARVRQHRAARPAGRAGARQRPRAVQLDGGVAETAGVNTLRAAFETGPDGALHRVLGAAGGAGGVADAAVAPGRDRLLRPRRRPARAHPPRGARRRRREDRGAGSGRPSAARPGAGQRRRPDLRQDPARRGLAGDPGRARRRLRRVAAPGAVLGRGLGHDPRRRDAGPRLRRAGAARHRRRERHRRRAVAAAPGAVGPHPVRRPGLGPDRPGLARRVRARRGARRRAGQRPPAGVGPGARHRWPPPTSSSDLLAGAARRVADSCPAWPSTPSCAGTCCTAWSSSGRAGVDEIEAEVSATRPPPASGTPPPAGPPVPTAEAKAEAWASVVDSDELPNAVQAAVIGGFAERRAGRAARAVRRALLRQVAASSGPPHRRDGAEPGRRPVPDAAGLARASWSAPTPTSAATTSRRRSSGCCSRAATAWSARCAPAPATREPERHRYAKAPA